MNKRRLCISFLFTCMLLLIAFSIIYVYEYPPLLYHKQLSHWHELPTRLIRPAFKHIMNMDLPPNVNGLRALFRGGRQQMILVKFETDSDGIAYILNTLGKSDAEWEQFDTNKLRSGREVFVALSVIQQEAGVCLLDQKSIDSGRLLTGRFFNRHEVTAYQIFLTDNQNITVYVGATIEERGP